MNLIIRLVPISLALASCFNNETDSDSPATNDDDEPGTTLDCEMGAPISISLGNEAQSDIYYWDHSPQRLSFIMSFSTQQLSLGWVFSIEPSDIADKDGQFPSAIHGGLGCDEFRDSFWYRPTENDEWARYVPYAPAGIAFLLIREGEPREDGTCCSVLAGSMGPIDYRFREMNEDAEGCGYPETIMLEEIDFTFYDIYTPGPLDECNRPE